jgi:hypothetical protein
MTDNTGSMDCNHIHCEDPTADNFRIQIDRIASCYALFDNPLQSIVLYNQFVSQCLYQKWSRLRMQAYVSNW